MASPELTNLLTQADALEAQLASLKQAVTDAQANVTATSQQLDQARQQIHAKVDAEYAS